MRETTYVLRTCAADMTANGGFVWPKNGPVECPDWNPQPECGNGLHGLLMGEGDAQLLSWAPDAKWLVVAVAAKNVVDLNGKVKFPRGEVVYCGERDGALRHLEGCGARYANLPGATLAGGDRAILTGGYRATLTGGDRATLAGGQDASQTGGGRASQAGGDDAILTGGYRAILTGGSGATFVVVYFNAAHRRCVAIATVGSNGILPGEAYRVNKRGEFVAVK